MRPRIKVKVNGRYFLYNFFSVQNAKTPNNETLQFLVIKEEPIEWSDVAEADMELVESGELFSTEITIKPEIFADTDSVSSENLYTPLTCELCSETFTVPAEWVRHVQTHTDMLPAKRQRRGRPAPVCRHEIQIIFSIFGYDYTEQQGFCFGVEIT